MLAYADISCEDKITMLYHERIPYAVTSNGSVQGLTATPVTLAFNKSGIDIDWIETPVKRQLLAIKMNKGCQCSIGWFKNSERETFARYSASIYQDKPQVAITSAHNKSLVSQRSLADALKNKQLSLLVKDGYSYGKFIDQKIQQYQPTTHSVLYENLKMLSLIYHQRYDYFFIAPEEVNYLIDASGFTRTDFKIIRFKDMPEGEKRYILCNKKVSEETIRRLNSNIAD